MRLLTHNLLTCHSRACSAPSNYPLKFNNVTSVEIIEAEYNQGFLDSLRSKVERQVLWDAIKELGVELEGEEEDKKAWKALMEVHVQEGEMVCPSCGHVFRIKDGIPNMLLAEHEIRR